MVVSTAPIEGKGHVEATGRAARRPVSLEHGFGGMSGSIRCRVLAGDDAVARQLRQQRRQGLRLGLQGGQTRRLGLAQLRIVLQGALIDGEQIRGREPAFAQRYKAKSSQQVAS